MERLQVKIACVSMTLAKLSEVTGNPLFTIVR
jgi:hypothetical protein